MSTLFFDPGRMAAAMDQAGVEALIATTAPNIQYLTAYRRGGDAIALLRRSDLSHPELIVGASNIDYCLEDLCDGVKVQAFGVFYRDFTPGVALTEREGFVREVHLQTKAEASRWDLTAELLHSNRLMASKIGTDASLETLAPLARLLPGLEMQSLPDLFKRLRMVKTPQEISRMAEAARVTEHAILTSAYSAIQGTTQRQLARSYSVTAIAANCSIRSDNASIGRGSALGNLNSPLDVVEEGSILRYDVGVFYEGYASDMARTFVFRKMGEKERRYHAALVAGLERELELVRPGAVACDIFAATMETARREGIPHYQRHHVGHGLGIAGAGYEPPLLGPADQTVLEPGMVLCVETPYVELGFGGLHPEDMLVVTEDGYRLLTHSERSLRILP
ncbi:MAG: Xaa-Pro peptidase family protein [Chloroflexi bacterium]|nr:Xaa-Pro peptidase family protein [Chloroflexota bacterium]